MDAKSGGYELGYKQDTDLTVRHLPIKLLLITKKKTITLWWGNLAD